MKAGDIRDALSRKFCAPEYALFFEVGDATGGRARRWADAVAMGLWPSRGLALQGFEIKVSRSDLLSELRNPAKAETVARYCRYWWLATPPGLVRDGELPEGWGLYEVHPSGIRCVKSAPIQAEAPVSPEFLAALLRRASQVDRDLEEAAITKAIDRDESRTRDRIAAEVSHLTYGLKERAERAEQQIKAIYDACGLTQAEVSGLFHYDAGFADAVAFVHRLGVARTYGGLKQVAEKLRPMADAVEALIGKEAVGA